MSVVISANPNAAKKKKKINPIHKTKSIFRKLRLLTGSKNSLSLLWTKIFDRGAFFSFNKF